MLPPGMNPKQLEQMLKQLGMTMENIPAKKVVISSDVGDIVIQNPQVVKTTMKGQVVYQVSGSAEEQLYTEDDVNLVMEQTGVKDKEKISKILQETKGDVVEAIMRLKS